MPHNYTLGSRFRPCRELGACNVVPGPMEAAGSLELGSSGGALGRGRGGGVLGGHLDSIFGRSGCRGAVGGNTHRGQAAVAARSLAPAR
jgi:hypothetical protein